MKGTQSVESTKNPQHPVIRASQYYHPLIWTNGSTRHRNSAQSREGGREGRRRGKTDREGTIKCSGSFFPALMR